eukprot:5255090-Prymnesium_polylepis.1
MSFDPGVFQTHTARRNPRACSHSTSSVLTTAGSAFRSMPSRLDECARRATAYASAAVDTYATRNAEWSGMRRLRSRSAASEKEIHESSSGRASTATAAAALAAVRRGSKVAEL